MLKTARLFASHLRDYKRGLKAAGLLSAEPTVEFSSTPNPLQEYFDSVREGPGVWKWRHYFEIYHRYLARFIGTPVVAVEVGIYSGGSLPMWRSYFGSQSHIVGVDIEPACKQYAAEGISIVIGDQASRSFWSTVRKQFPAVDILIDDGGHAPEQQMVTVEEMLPHLRPGGVYICEDIHGNPNGFASFVAGLQAALHHAEFDGRLGSVSSTFQRAVAAVHIYPFMVVFEKGSLAGERFVSEKHGTQWQPFL